MIKAIFSRAGRFSVNYLDSYDGSRKNNFTIIRILFAWLVLYGHSYAIQGDGGFKDPLNEIFQGSVWIGALAVDGFFAISGFLVTASVLKRSLLNYTLSRALRIFPALVVCVFMTAMLMGPLASSLNFSEYFSSPQAYEYLRNVLAFDKMRWELPGVFEGHRKQAVNGSLWSLTVEVRCYLLLALVASLGFLRTRTIANFTIVALFFLVSSTLSNCH